METKNFGSMGDKMMFNNWSESENMGGEKIIELGRWSLFTTGIYILNS